MAHKEQKDFCLKVKSKFPEFFKNKKVLDIGSLDINGSNRDLFENCNYLGLDVGEGKNVDVVSVGHLFDGPENYFDLIISTEVFEHDMYYEQTIKNIIRMLKPGGLFLFTCAAPGRPEHGTRRTGAVDAPLLLQISEEWADYYKNLDENDIRKISGFNEVFPDCYFELNNIYCNNPADLYFYGIKGGEKYLTSNITPTFNKEDWSEHVIVIDCWPDNESKENDLLKLIKTLKTYNIDIVLTGHYSVKPEIQKMVDYYIFDKKNPILLSEEFDDYDVNSGRWTETGEYRITNKYEFHHDYAIWETMRNVFNFCNYLNKKYIHFFEYDNIPDEIQFRQSFIEKIQYHDAVLYEYKPGSTKDNKLSQYCATYIFSIKTDIAVKVVDQIKNKSQYFKNRPGGWQLERIFLSCLNNLTNNIKISEYIANNNELNTQAVWNRDGMNMNGAIFQSYLGVDDDGYLYLHLISGFHEKKAKKDYTIEVNYCGYKKFILLKKSEYILEKIGEYRKGETIKIYYEGVLVFKEFLGKDYSDFKKLNYVFFKNRVPTSRTVKINYLEGPKVEINGGPLEKYLVEFLDDKNNLIYSSELKSNMWAQCDKKYFIKWKIRINGTIVDEFSLENKTVLISLESKSIGDTLAWAPYSVEFAKKHNCKVFLSTFHNEWFNGLKEYENIEFINPGQSVNCTVVYRIGWFRDSNGGWKKFDSYPNQVNLIPLQKTATDILGLEYKELNYGINFKINERPINEKYIAIGPKATSGCKEWDYNHWVKLCEMIINSGYKVISLTDKEFNINGVTNFFGRPWNEVFNTLYHSEFFIGLGSGLSWVNWALNKKTIMINGFSADGHEFTKNLIKINNNKCIKCWNDPVLVFDSGDWDWCPIYRGTELQHDCQKSITPEQVFSKLNL